MPILLLPWLAFPCAGVPLQAAELPAFRDQTVTKDLKLGHQIVPVDLNHDGKKDLIVVDERATELAWFQNPGWQRHVLMSDVARPINADCHDTDGDGIPDMIIRDYTSPYETWEFYPNGGELFAPFSMAWNNPSAWNEDGGNRIRNINNTGTYTAVVDMNGDGLPDRVVYDRTSGSMR